MSEMALAAYLWPSNLIEGKRFVCVKERRTKVDYAEFMKLFANSVS